VRGLASIRLASVRVVGALCSLSLLGCATTSGEAHGGRRVDRADRSGGHYVWVDAHCSDGPVDLAQVGFERTLDMEKREGGWLLTYETRLATHGCQSTSVWTAQAQDELYLFRLEPQAWVSWPMRGPAASETDRCGVEERDATLGEIHVAGDTLELVTRGSPWCRGFDAHFIYRSAPAQPMQAAALVARYVAHFSRGDAAALSALFESRGTLIEPFTASPDGQPTRHQGRAAIRAYFERVFASATWHAARLLTLGVGGEAGANEIVADLEYIDSELAEPLRVRSSFVLAGGEIFESDNQLVTDPNPREGAAPQTTPPMANVERKR